MLPDRVSNPGPLTYESGALPIALRGPAPVLRVHVFAMNWQLPFLNQRKEKQMYVAGSIKSRLDIMI